MSTDFLTFKYSGREPRLLKEFLCQFPDIVNRRIYDINLTTGSLLYRCANGGIGATKEPHIVNMHSWIKTSTSTKTLLESYKEWYGKSLTRRKYAVLKEHFNYKCKGLDSWNHCSRLYLLWLGSSFMHRYKINGYDATYFPTTLNEGQFSAASRVSREKNLLFEHRDIFSFRESELCDNTVVYSHLPGAFAAYGAGWKWGEPQLTRFCRLIGEVSSMGAKVLISAPHQLRGREAINYKSMFPNFNSVVIEPQFKAEKSVYRPPLSETYLFNF